MHLQLAGRRRRVDALGERHQRDAKRLDIPKKGHKMAEVLAEAVQSPDQIRRQGRTRTVAPRTFEGSSLT